MSGIQHSDAGTIGTLKVRYRSYQMDRALDMAEDENIKEIYKVNVLFAMQAWKRIWNEMGSEIIANCWCHTGTLAMDAKSIRVSRQEDKFQLHKIIQNLVPWHTRANINYLPNPVGENN